jgi:hypothetical protein
MSPHVKNSFDQTVARTAALDYNAALQAAFSANPEIGEGGVRLHDVDVTDPLYQRWVANFTNEFNEKNGVAGLNPTAQAALVPAIQDTQSRVTLAQDELRSERRLQAFEDSTVDFVTDALYDLEGNAEFVSGNDPDALVLAANLLTQQFDEAVQLGYGGKDLEGIYGRAIDQVIAVALQTSNPQLATTCGQVCRGGTRV